MKFLLDTCVVSEFIAKQPDSGLVEWIDSQAEEKLYLSVISIGEIKKGIEKLPDSGRRSELTTWLEDDLLIRFKDRILPIDVNVMLVWGSLTANLEQQGRTMTAIDSLIAAIAIQGELDLVTRNETDFEHSGVPVINPWTK
jgi:predicted nucleic acid-binding protein